MKYLVGKRRFYAHSSSKSLGNRAARGDVGASTPRTSGQAVVVAFMQAVNAVQGQICASLDFRTMQEKLVAPSHAALPGQGRRARISVLQA